MQQNNLYNAQVILNNKKKPIQVKKANTLKVMAIVTTYTFIKFMSQVFVGKKHDFSLLKSVFPPEQNWFEKIDVRVDLGYLDMATQYKCKNVLIPNKKSKNNPLTEQKKKRIDN